MSEVNELSLAYIAGIVDGEGYVGLTKGGSEAVVKVKMSHKPTIMYLKRTMGVGQITEWDPNKNGLSGRKILYSWTLYTRQARDFIRMVTPYLITKKRIAKQLMKKSVRAWRRKKTPHC